MNKEEKQKLWSLVQEIKAELEPVIDHLLDVGHLLNATHLLNIRDNLLKVLEDELQGEAF